MPATALVELDSNVSSNDSRTTPSGSPGADSAAPAVSQRHADFERTLSLGVEGLAFLVATAQSVLVYAVFQVAILFAVLPILVLGLLLVVAPLGALVRMAFGRRGHGRGTIPPLLVLSFAWLLIWPAAIGWIGSSGSGRGPTDWPWHTSIWVVGGAGLPALMSLGWTELVFYSTPASRRGYAGLYAALALGSAFGAPLAYVALETGGFLALGCVVSSLALGVAAIEARRSRTRRAHMVAAVLALVLAAVPGHAFDGRWIGILPARGPASAPVLEAQGYRIVHQQWGRYSWLCLMRHPDTGTVAGLMSDEVHWLHWGSNAPVRPLDSIPFRLARPDLPAAIVGAGGGRQVRWALDAGFHDLTAIEIEPGMARYLTEVDPGLVGGDLVSPGVIAVVGEGRRVLSADGPLLGLIYLPDVGAAAYNLRNLLLQNTFLETREALELYARRLAPDGILARYYLHRFDARGLMRRHTEAALRAAGFRSVTLMGEAGYVTVAALGERGETLRDRVGSIVAEAAWEAELAEDEAPPDELETRIGTDRDPLPTLFSAFTAPELGRALRIALLVVAVFAAALFAFAFVARGRGRDVRGVCRRTSDWAPLFASGILVGLHFAVLELHFVDRVSALVRETFYVSMVGGLVFLATAGAGSFGLARADARILGVGSAALALSWWSRWPASASAGLASAGMLVAAFATGPLFRSLLRPRPRLLVLLFLTDSLGALTGNVVAFLGQPILRSTRFGMLAVAVTVVAYCVAGRVAARIPGASEA